MGKHADYKDDLIKEGKDTRERKFAGLRKEKVVRGKRSVGKDWKEQAQERLDKDEVDRRLRAEVFERAASEFHGGQTPKNPFHDGVAGTMFWM